MIRRPHPLAVAAIAVPLAAIGWLLWRDQGALIWLGGFIAYCL